MTQKCLCKFHIKRLEALLEKEKEKSRKFFDIAVKANRDHLREIQDNIWRDEFRTKNKMI